MHLKTLQFCDNFYPQIDGVVQVVDNTAKIMNRTNETKVIVPNYTGKAFDDSVFSYEVFRRDTNTIKALGFDVPLPVKTKELTEKIFDFGANIYHAHSPFFIGKYGLKLAREQDIPIVATFHSQFKKDALSITHSKMIAQGVTNAVTRYFNRCDEVWAPSRATAAILRSYGYEKDIFVMENGTDFEYPENIDEIVDTVRTKYDIQSNARNLLFVGQIREVKNIKLILETLKKLLEKDVRYRLYLVGEGVDMPKYRTWLQEQGIEKYARFLGKVCDRTELAGIYAACDLFFFPSSYDNAPIVVREACTMKTPVLCLKDTAAAEPFTDGVNGYLGVENAEKLAEKIDRIFENDETRIAVGESASKIPFSFELMAKRTLERYEIVIDRYERNKYAKSKV